MEFVPLKMVCHLYQPIPCHAYILEYISNKDIRMYSLINLNIGHWTWHHFGEWQSAREIPIIYMAGTFPWYVCFKNTDLSSIDPSYSMQWFSMMKKWEEIVGDLSSEKSASIRMNNLGHRKQIHTEDQFEFLIQKGYYEEDGKMKM